VRRSAAAAPLREREFRLLFAGRTVSLLGNAIAPVALAFAVLDLTGSKTDLGLILACRELPLVVFLLAGGIWADRLPRNRVMVGANLVSGASQAAVAALLIAGEAEIWHLAALAALNGGASAFYFPASAGVIPQTVPQPLLQQANALLGLTVNATQIGGAALGGLLVAVFGPGPAIAVDAATYFVAAAILAGMRLDAGAREQARSFFAELATGWREFRSRTWLWAIVLQFSLLLGVVIGSFSVLGPVVADDELGGSSAWGLILTAQALGLLAGGLLGLRWRPRRMLLVATLAMLPVSATLVALGFPLSLPAIAGAAFVAGFCLEIFVLLWNTTMQQEIPADKLSRVYSYDALGSFLLVPIGLAAAGPIAELVGSRATLWGAAATAVAVTLPVLLVRDVRVLERSTPSPSPASALL
jgi:MFS family permease